MPKNEEHAANYEKAYRSFWDKRKLKLAKLNPGTRSKAPLTWEIGEQEPHRTISATQSWLTGIGSTVSVIPGHLFHVDFPTEDIAPIPPRPGIRINMKQRTKAVLKVSVPRLAEYVSPEMTDSIKQSPFYVRDEDIILLRCNARLNQVLNGSFCVEITDFLLRNIANEIVYRENGGEIDRSQ